MRAFLLLVAAILTPGTSRLSATSIEAPAFEDLVAKSEHVFRGTVTSTRCEWRGSGPARRITTVVTLAISENIVGSTLAQTELVFLGGEIDGEGMQVVGQPTFSVGDDDILFVAANGRAFCPLVAMGYGRYLVAKDETGKQFMARGNGVPLASIAEVRSSMPEGGASGLMKSLKQGSALSPSDFIREIRATAQTLGRKDIVAQP